MSDPKERAIEPQPYALREFADQAPPPQAQAEEAQEVPLDLNEERFMLLIPPKKKVEDPRVLAERQAQAMLAEAQTQADQMRQEAYREAKERGYEEGFAQGTEDGRNAYQARVEAVLADLGRVVDQLDQARLNVIAHLEEEVLAVVMAACEAVLATPVVSARASLAQIVRLSLGRVIDDGKATVKVAPADLEKVKQFGPELLRHFAELEQLKFAADESLNPGDVVVDSPLSSVDATLASRARRTFARLEDALRSAEPLDLNALSLEPPPPRPAALTEAAESVPPPAAELLDAEDW